MCSNFCMMYYLENTELTECKTWGIPIINLELAGEGLLSHIKNLDTSQSHLDCRGYSCHQRLLSIWHDTNHMIRWMEWWCIFLTVKHVNTLTVSILTFQLNQGTCVLGYIQTDSIHSRYFLVLIFVGRLYSRFITCHWGCVWGRSSCFYLRSYPVLIVRGEI
jgi:hypothetical protein